MFGSTQQKDVGHSRQGPVFKVLIIFTKIYDAAGKFWIIQKAVKTQEWNPLNLWRQKI
jgi:hypothetical protein